MKVKDLIFRLQLFPPDAEVRAELDDGQGWVSVGIQPAMIYKDPSDNIVWIDLEE